ncbi:MAG: hypothetical protein B7Y25_01540 [Alphaproteobacteria bacterium 16-39-46]|nr:MAG: hypothetical protein B7Y25_01540 [Alphaproteobacteria bacterium 16-39-46]OZA44099.1 MAG: hypothetical protein B7X84_01525 [Alphaproteobacteria bacterium 17-39-52]HQS84991.1 pyridoxamine 5'-phosphate oxidase family protein [Alphaproteobacteria bacterium]HQS94801.1 pyridoxamine 5'-phosphate oxidase family protein [Alphaproteobacteria bacterium]
MTSKKYLFVFFSLFLLFYAADFTCANDEPVIYADMRFRPLETSNLESNSAYFRSHNDPSSTIIALTQDEAPSRSFLEQNTVVLTTLDENGFPSSRKVDFTWDPDGNGIFETPSQSDKISQIQAYNKVSVHTSHSTPKHCVQIHKKGTVAEIAVSSSPLSSKKSVEKGESAQESYGFTPSVVNISHSKRYYDKDRYVYYASDQIEFTKDLKTGGWVKREKPISLVKTRYRLPESAFKSK